MIRDIVTGDGALTSKAVAMQTSLQGFGDTAKALSRNPLGVIALFIVLVYGMACLVIYAGSLNPSEKLPIIYFLVVFPFVVLGAFTYLVSFRAGQLFAPGDFKDEQTYLKLQQMRVSAVASLTAAKQTRESNRIGSANFQIEDVVRSVDVAVERAQERATNPTVLWVDDNPINNHYERIAMESVGIRFVISETTKDALAKLADRRFDAVISDMGRREGAREGYVLLDAMRSRGDDTPLFFYASSNAPEHKEETFQHGGQGCTNDGQDLFDLVTRTVFSSRHLTDRDRRRPGGRAAR